MVGVRKVVFAFGEQSALVACRTSKDLHGELTQTCMRILIAAASPPPRLADGQFCVLGLAPFNNKTFFDTHVKHAYVR